MHAARGERPNAPQIICSDIVASARIASKVNVEGHERKESPPLKSVSSIVVNHILPNEQDPALFVSCGEYGPAGKGRAHYQTTASSPESSPRKLHAHR